MSVLRSLLSPGPSRSVFPLLLATVLLALSRPSVGAPALVRLHGHVPHAAVAHAQSLGRIASDENVRLALALPLRDLAGSRAFLARLYDPAAPEYGHYLTGNQFTERFGPTQQSYDAVLAFARARGLEITGTYPNRLLVDVSGPASAVESAFAVHLLRYRSAEGRVFRAPDSEPAIPAALAGRLSGVIGLADVTPARPHFQRLDTGQGNSLVPRLRGNNVGTAPDGGLAPADIKTAYDLNRVPQTGAGRTLALYELDGYTLDDITQYETSYSLPTVPLTNILVGQADGSAGAGAIEVTLDIEMMAAVAPGATKILVYEGKNGTTDQVDTYNRIATDDIAKEVSTSWGLAEDLTDSTTLNTENAIFQQMAAQGQSLYAAAGDSGAYDGFDNNGLHNVVTVDDPASQPFVTGVGGTKLSVTAPGGSYQSESAWGDPSELLPDGSNPHGAGGGGGVSGFWSLPDYQSGIAGVSKVYRNVPDVSLDADPNTGYSIYYATDGGFETVGGTSAAAPLWAAYTALVNQVRVGQKQAVLGFPNLTLYPIGAGTNYAKGFHDVTTGTNLLYAAVSGYDNATGFGSFDGAGLLALVAPPPTTSNNPLASLTLNPPSIVGGLTSTGTVTLSNPAPSGGTTVLLTSSDTTTATVPASVAIAPGGTTGTFKVTTVAVTTLKPVTITATLGANSLTAALQVTPPLGSIAPMSVAFSPARVCGGGVSTGTVTLNGPAPAGGLSVALSSSDASVSVPGSVTIAAAATTATFNVATSIVALDTPVTVTATANSMSQMGTLTVLAATLEPFNLSVAQITGGRQLSASVNLSCPAPPGGSVVALASDNPAASVPPSVTVPTGSTVGTFVVTTVAVPSAVTATVTATYNGQTQTVPLKVQPGGLVGLTLVPTSVTGGGSSVGTLTLDTPAPGGGIIVTMSSDTPGAATVPASVVVPGGASTASFPITTTGVSAVTVAKITATLNGSSLPATLTVLPIQVTGLTVNPLRVILGGSAKGTVTINNPAPAGGLVVALSSGSAVATVPAAVVVPAGTTSTTFTITGAAVGTANLAAALGGQTQTATLSVLSAPGTTYPAGLNLLSVPYDYSGQTLDSVFGYAGVRLAVWQPGAGAYALTPNSPADALRPGQGYWVKLPRSLSLTSVGTPADRTTDFSIPLQSGWNQIGDPFPISIKMSGLQAVGSSGTSVPFAQAVTGSPLLLSALVYGYTPASGTKAGAYAYVSSDGSLQPGQGYWMYAYQAVTLIVPHPAQ